MTLEAKLIGDNNRNILTLKREAFSNTAAVVFNSLAQTLGRR